MSEAVLSPAKTLPANSGGTGAPLVAVSAAEMATRAERIGRLKSRLEDIRQQVRKRFESGATGVQSGALLSELMDGFVVTVFTENLDRLPHSDQEIIEANTALLAVGGTGRGELCPYSDLDLLFLCEPKVLPLFQPFAAQVQRDLYDTVQSLGASVRTVDDALRFVKVEPQFATSLVDTRLLWGSAPLAERLTTRYVKWVRSHPQQFANAVIASREKERLEHRATTQQLEPDVKRALGGLRDLHLIRWLGFGCHDTVDPTSLRLKGELTMDESLRIVQTHDYLMTLRFDLHFHAGREQDVLTRDEQMRIAERRAVQAGVAQTPVERFMQEYFRHSMSLAEIARRFAVRSSPPSWTARLAESLISRRADDIYLIGPRHVHVIRRHRAAVCGSLERILKLFLTAVRYRVLVHPEMVDLIKAAKLAAPAALSTEAAQSFLALLKEPGTLGAALRTMHETGVLEAVLPCWEHIRCLLQFNPYHHFTVDEHTLRAIETAEGFLHDEGSLGQAYRELRHKELLHLALLMHDAGKGFEEDHSEVGRRLSHDVALRLGLPDHQRELVMLLVHRHLQMADIALRRDINDSGLLLKFSHQVGSPEALRMLYVLTAADITAVGPGTWNSWKAEFLSALYDRTMLWLTGKSHLFDEATRLKRISTEVASLLAVESNAQTSGESFTENQEIVRHLEKCPAHYLLETPPTRIAADMRIVRTLRPEEIHVEAQYDAETKTVEYRILLHEKLASGVFHKLSGALSAKRLEILSAAICTTQDGIIIDAFRVQDADHAAEIPDFRIEEVSQAIRRVLRGETDVATLLKSRGRFAPKARTAIASELPLRVVVDNDSSDRYTVVDVFAHDRPGLLYTISRTLYELKLSVALAKIATHLDQVLDVFFVTDEAGSKIHDGPQLTAIRDRLMESLTVFEANANAEQSPC